MMQVLDANSFHLSSDALLPATYAGKRYSIVLVMREDDSEILHHQSVFFNPLCRYANAIREKLAAEKNKQIKAVVIYEESGVKPYIKRIGRVYIYV